MLIRLSEMSPLPLREQIVCRIREMILSGELPERHRLPSLRSLAQDLRVGVVTVQRAYEDLEREAMIYPRQGKGYFVRALEDAKRRELAERRVAAALRRPLREARQMGVAEDRIRTLVDEVLADDPVSPAGPGPEE